MDKALLNDNIIVEENDSEGSCTGMDEMNESASSNAFTLPKKINDFKAHSNSGLMKTSSLPSTIKSRSGF